MEETLCMQTESNKHAKYAVQHEKSPLENAWYNLGIPKSLCMVMIEPHQDSVQHHYEGGNVTKRLQG